MIKQRFHKEKECKQMLANKRKEEYTEDEIMKIYYNHIEWSSHKGEDPDDFEDWYRDTFGSDN